MNLAVIAAFAAAAISLVNVVLTAGLTRGSQFRQWQRETALPITARILALSEEATEAWASAVGAHSEWLRLREDKQRVLELEELADKYLAAGRAALGKLRFEGAQLNLIGSPATRVAAAALATQHNIAEAMLSGHPSAESLSKTSDGISDLMDWEDSLIAKFRTDLGLPSDVDWRSRLREIRH